MNSEGCWSWGPQAGRIRQPPAFCQICRQEMSVFSSWTCLKSQWEELCLVSLWAGSGRSWMLDPVYGTTLRWLMEWWQARHDSNSKIFHPSLAELPSTKLFMLIIPRVFECLTLSLLVTSRSSGPFPVDQDPFLTSNALLWGRMMPICYSALWQLNGTRTKQNNNQPI